MRSRSNNRARHRPGGIQRRRRFCVSVTVVQLLLGLWVGVGMHVVHPLFHHGHGHWGGHAGRFAAPVHSVDGCSHGCSHRHESEDDNTLADSHSEAVGAAIATSGPDDSAHGFTGRCPICCFLAQTGKWMHSASPLVLAHAEPTEALPDHGHHILGSLHLSSLQARAPPSRFSSSA
jgi:hypothetical protein